MIPAAEPIPPSRRLASLVNEAGIPYYRGGGPAVEAALLALLALSYSEPGGGTAKALLARISALQGQDGSVGLNPVQAGQGLWLTAPAAIVFHRYGLKDARDRALGFLLSLKSVTVANDPNVRQDNTIVGWPWVPGTFGWVEPTAWSVVALGVAGRGGHPRAVEGRRFLLDRQIPSGGWNYGNPGVNDRELLPFWDTTGLALLAFGRQPEAARVRPSLDFLETNQDRIRSLCGLAWAVLGLECHGRGAAGLKQRLRAALDLPADDALNAAHFAVGVAALAGPKVFLP
jgi:hypothetical protein